MKKDIVRLADEAASRTEPIVFEDGTYQGDLSVDNLPCGYGIFRYGNRTEYMNTTDGKNEIFARNTPGKNDETYVASLDLEENGFEMRKRE